MKKQILVLGLLLIVVTGLTVLFFTDSPNQISDPKERHFSIEQMDEITAFELSSPKGSIKVEEVDQQWLTNGNAVNLSHLQGFKDLVKNISVKYRVAKSSADSIVDELKNNGVKFECFNENQLIACYYVGSDLKDSTGAYCMKCDGKEPFVVYQLGEKKLFSKMFVVKENSWQSKVLLDTKGERIKAIELNYYQDSANTYTAIKNSFESFLIQIDSTNFAVFDGNENEIISLNFASVVDYLRAFTVVEAKEIVAVNLNRNPFCELRVQLESSQITLTAYRKKANPGQVDFTGKPLTFDNEYFYIKRGKTLYLVDYFTFDELLKKATDFKE